MVKPTAKGKPVEPNEDQLVAAIRKVLSGDSPGVIVPVGDDAAVVDPGRYQGLLTADMLVERVHFRLGATSAHDLGHKAITASVSDVAAMGGSPRFALVSLALSPDVEGPWVMELYGGIRAASQEYGMSVVGGDVSGGDRVVVSVALYGEVAPGRAVTRAGARPGERLVVTGELGAAAGGLVLARGSTDDIKHLLSTEAGRALVGALDRPTARVGEGHALGQAGATAMIDLSDGLGLDLHRLCRESGVGARVWLDRIPVSPALVELGGSLDADPLDLALHGGEDFELLAALQPGDFQPAAEHLKERFGTRLHEIGEVVEASDGILAIAADGKEQPLEARGWDHFG